ncbi:MAG: hypothetical protein ABIF71_06510 [Planctomycetota bacterium]
MTVVRLALDAALKTAGPLELAAGTVTLIRTGAAGLARIEAALAAGPDMEIVPDGQAPVTAVFDRECSFLGSSAARPRTGLWARLFGGGGDADAADAARAFGLAVKLTGRRSAGEERLAALMAVLGRKAACAVLVNPDDNLDVMVRRSFLEKLAPFAVQRRMAVLVVSTDDTLAAVLKPGRVIELAD